MAVCCSTARVSVLVLISWPHWTFVLFGELEGRQSTFWLRDHRDATGRWGCSRRSSGSWGDYCHSVILQLVFLVEGGAEALGLARAGLLWCRLWLLSSAPCTQQLSSNIILCSHPPPPPPPPSVGIPSLCPWCDWLPVASKNDEFCNGKVFVRPLFFLSIYIFLLSVFVVVFFLTTVHMI